MERIVFILICVILLFVDTAQAGIFGTVRSWLSGEVIALVATALLAIVAGVLGVSYRKIANTFKELGEFLTAISSALEDNKLSREELAKIVKEGKDIFAIWF